MTEEAKREFTTQRGICWLLSGLLTAPLAFLTYLAINYAVVPHACSSGHMLASHLVTALFVLIVLAGAFIAWRNWKEAGRGEPTGAAGVVERSRFIAVVGLMLSGLVLILFVAQWIPQFLISPCQR
ncbi:MAG TPA: hypothetical protein VJ842_18305 [Pyrinomonadaceae bacterium]|nr:hypothetical protein [Pyrinomonadaceae bacterium]